MFGLVDDLEAGLVHHRRVGRRQVQRLQQRRVRVLAAVGIGPHVELDLANAEVELLRERPVAVVEARRGRGVDAAQRGEHLRVRRRVVAVVRAEHLHLVQAQRGVEPVASPRACRRARRRVVRVRARRRCSPSTRPRSRSRRRAAATSTPCRRRGSSCRRERTRVDAGYAPGHEGSAMKVTVDADLCVGHGRCYVLGPDVFGTDEFGHCVDPRGRRVEARSKRRRGWARRTAPSRR